LNRRNFLGLVAVAAPAVFLPKLIEPVSWGIVKPQLPPLIYLKLDPNFQGARTIMIPFIKELTQPAIFGKDPIMVEPEDIFHPIVFDEIQTSVLEKMRPGKQIKMRCDGALYSFTK